MATVNMSMTTYHELSDSIFAWFCLQTSTEHLILESWTGRNKVGGVVETRDSDSPRPDSNPSSFCHSSMPPPRSRQRIWAAFPTTACSEHLERRWNSGKLPNRTSTHTHTHSTPRVCHLHCVALARRIASCSILVPGQGTTCHRVVSHAPALAISPLHDDFVPARRGGAHNG